jgi:biotin transport system substrate-specific component
MNPAQSGGAIIAEASVPAEASTLAGVVWPARANAILRMAALVVAGVALMTIAAKIKVPFPPVPVTLQTLAVPLIAAAFGARLGTATVLAYLIAGFAGLPVFTNTPPLAAGPFYFLGPTGGYLLAYPLAAWIVGSVAESGAGRSLPALFGAMLLGGAAVFACGFVWLAFVAQLASGGVGLGAKAAWLAGVQPFLLPDLVKIALAATLIRAGWAVVEKVRG